MTRITTDLLNDTYNVVQLARETARLQGQAGQAERLQPLVDGLHSLLTGPAAAAAPAARPSSELLAQNDFRALLNAVSSVSAADGANAAASRPAQPAAERSQLVLAMSAGGMTEVEIARQMGVSREEIHLMIHLQQPARPAAARAYRPDEVIP
jgi:DNA-binding NarL/FixJ family response regulator